MAGNSRILGRIVNVTRSSDTPDTDAQFIVNYLCTGPVVGAVTGEALLQVDVTQTDGQITAALRSALATLVDPLIQPPQTYSGNDVRGLNV